MEEVMEIFKIYEPIRSIYETETDYICIPKTNTEPLAVYYDKKLGDYKEIYFYQDMKGNIVKDLELANKIYGEELDFGDKL